MLLCKGTVSVEDCKSSIKVNREHYGYYSDNFYGLR